MRQQLVPLGLAKLSRWKTPYIIQTLLYGIAVICIVTGLDISVLGVVSSVLNIYLNAISLFPVMLAINIVVILGAVVFGALRDKHAKADTSYEEAQALQQAFSTLSHRKAKGRDCCLDPWPFSPNAERWRAALCGASLRGARKWGDISEPRRQELGKRPPEADGKLVNIVDK